MKSALSAIIWDYDGTLVDTRQKNLNVAKRIIEEVSGRPASDFPALHSLQSYDQANKRSANWRELYEREFGFTPAETDAAGVQWTPYQLADQTPTPVYQGIEGVIRALTGPPHGIVSMNSKRNIEQVLLRQGLTDLFSMVVGYEEVDIQKQKPEPDGLLNCVECLAGFPTGCVVYVGDHETDAKCAHNANRILAQNGSQTRIVSVGVFYGNHNDAADWHVQPDYKAESPARLLEVIQQVATAGPPSSSLL